MRFSNYHLTFLSFFFLTTSSLSHARLTTYFRRAEPTTTPSLAQHPTDTPSLIPRQVDVGAQRHGDVVADKAPPHPISSHPFPTVTTTTTTTITVPPTAVQRRAEHTTTPSNTAAPLATVPPTPSLSRRNEEANQIKKDSNSDVGYEQIHKWSGPPPPTGNAALGGPPPVTHTETETATVTAPLHRRALPTS